MWLSIDVLQQLSHTCKLPKQRENRQKQQLLPSEAAITIYYVHVAPNSTSLSDVAAAAHSRVVPEHPVDPGPLIGPPRLHQRLPSRVTASHATITTASFADRSL
jgi:hypothetical protein